MLMIITGAILFIRPHSVATITYLRGPIPITSTEDPHVLNPVLTCDLGGSQDSSCTLSKNNDSLILRAGGHTILAKEKGNNELAPVISLPVSGDFIAQVKIVFQPGPICCKHAGLGVRSADDINSWIRISRDHADTIQLDGLLRGHTTNSSAPNYTSDRVWFKIERRGELFTLSYSADGVNWTPLRKDYEFLLSEDAQIFLFAHSAYQQDIVSAEFSDLSVK
jgi:regulation of enolase protein 1 (concanavalin A-like superfamily)